MSKTAEPVKSFNEKVETSSNISAEEMYLHGKGEGHVRR